MNVVFAIFWPVVFTINAARLILMTLFGQPLAPEDSYNLRWVLGGAVFTLMALMFDYLGGAPNVNLWADIPYVYYIASPIVIWVGLGGFYLIRDMNTSGNRYSQWTRRFTIGGMHIVGVFLIWMAIRIVVFPETLPEFAQPRYEIPTTIPTAPVDPNRVA